LKVALITKKQTNKQTNKQTITYIDLISVSQAVARESGGLPFLA
jgi:hypothetical protein